MQFNILSCKLNANMKSNVIYTDLFMKTQVYLSSF